MRFTHNGALYTIEFRREHRMVEAYNPATGDYEEVKSKYPYTLVDIRKYPNPDKVDEFTVIGTAEQGCAPEDVFYKETGRKRALKKVTSKVPKELRAILWDTYMNRAKPVVRSSPPKGGSAVSQPAILMNEVVEGEVVSIH